MDYLAYYVNLGCGLIGMGLGWWLSTIRHKQAKRPARKQWNRRPQAGTKLAEPEKVATIADQAAHLNRQLNAPVLKSWRRTP